MNQELPCDKTIKIDIRPSGAFEYTVAGSDAEHLPVKRGEWICWECTNPDFPFAVNFGFRTPVSGQGGHAPPGGTIRLRINDVQERSYKYYVAVCTNSHERILMHDPDLIVGP